MSVFSKVRDTAGGAARSVMESAVGNFEIGQAWAAAARDRSVGPYPYLAPVVRRAAQVSEPPLNSTPHQVVYTKGKMRLLRFEPAVRKHKTPILFVYSLINRYYILDFLPGRSLIEFMRDQGFDCYAIDWGVPGEVENHMGWSDMLGGLIQSAVKWTLRTSGARDLTLYGYCMGGTMALAYASLYPEGLRNFVAQATPVDFHEGGIFHTWTRPEYFNVDAMVDAYGSAPIDLMEAGFSMMAPVQRLTKWLNVFRQIDDKKFVTLFLAMEKWASDNVPFPGGVYRQYIKDCYQENNFCNGRMVVGGRRVDLGNITCPLLNLIADKDTIAPPASSVILNELVGSEDKTLMNFPVGHIGLSTSSKGPKMIWPKVAEWMAERSEPMAEA
jgi:polyhydroxyalkanoate synthase